jgi:murein DD-endopeptidase MepM/ murein hydrolase activator NlpD
VTPDEYNRAELVAGRLTISHITALVLEFQRARQLSADGMAGPKTRAAIERLAMGRPGTAPTPDDMVLAYPLPVLPDGRIAVITSSFRPADRPNHDGVDLFYRWRAGDKPDFVGDKGCAGKNPDGTPKWVIPYGVTARAAAAGTVQIAGNSPTGYRLWIDHDNGLRTGYFHLLDLRVAVGQVIPAGTELGLIGDNPKDHDGRHLHFELSPVDRYAPIDPAPYLTL